MFDIIRSTDSQLKFFSQYESIHYHASIRISTSKGITNASLHNPTLIRLELNKTIAVGSYGLTGHNKAEWFDSGDFEVTEAWEVLMDCPIAERYSGFATFALGSDFYFFGGYKYQNGYRDTDETFKFCKPQLQSLKL